MNLTLEQGLEVIKGAFPYFCEELHKIVDVGRTWEHTDDSEYVIQSMNTYSIPLDNGRFEATVQFNGDKVIGFGFVFEMLTSNYSAIIPRSCISRSLNMDKVKSEADLQKHLLKTAKALITAIYRAGDMVNYRDAKGDYQTGDAVKAFAQRRCNIAWGIPDTVNKMRGLMYPLSKQLDVQYHDELSHVKAKFEEAYASLVVLNERVGADHRALSPNKKVAVKYMNTGGTFFGVI